MKALPPPEARELERLRYWQGQMLRSRDFRDGGSIDEQLRWWHVRAMHGVSGIAAGFSVQLSGSEVQVEAGLAYDWFGRELLHPCNRTLPVPSEDSMVLLARRRQRTGRRAAKCCEAAESIVELVWKKASSFRYRDGVALAAWSNQKLLPYPQRVRALSRPKVISGTTVPGATPWRPWDIALPNEQTLHGLQVKIDLTAAGFTQTPCCFAWLERPPAATAAAIQNFELQWQGVSEVSAAGFTFLLLPWTPEPEVQPLMETMDMPESTPTVQRYDFFVSWLAMESCHPPDDSSTTDGGLM